MTLCKTNTAQGNAENVCAATGENVCVAQLKRGAKTHGEDPMPQTHVLLTIQHVDQGLPCERTHIKHQYIHTDLTYFKVQSMSYKVCFIVF